MKRKGKRTPRKVRVQWMEMNFLTKAEKNAEKLEKTMVWATHDGNVLVMEAIRSILRWAVYKLVEEQECLRQCRWILVNVSKWKNPVVFSQQSCGLGHKFLWQNGDGKRKTLGRGNVG